MLGKGYIHVYTGNGKGKTTAALGLAFRAWGRGLRTYVGQFMKGQFYAELAAAARTDGHIVIEQYGKDTFVHVKHPPEPEDVAMAQAGFAKLKQAMLSNDYQIIVADEIITALYFHLLAADEVLALMREKPNRIELILTGRYCPAEIIAAADLVTEMCEVKHYYAQNVPARDGVER